MRWFIQVWPVGTDGAHERYQVEAVQWQGALQIARKLRGDRGPMSRFNIDVLDGMYRAIDPASRLRYEVNRAPEVDAPGANGSSRPAPVARPRAAAGVIAPPKAPTAPPEPPSAPAPQAPSAAPTERSAPPPLQLLRRRAEEPTEAVPIVYREVAYAVAVETSPADLERLLREAFEQVRSELEGTQARKFVQLALFDHVFEGRPERPPVAVLAWKDWRGDPVVQLPGAPPAAPQQPPAGPPSEAPAEGSTARAALGSAQPAPATDPADSAATEPAAAAPRPASVPPAGAGPRPASVPPAGSARRRSPTDDLIGELFEGMHQLHFMPDLPSGCEYVLGVLRNVIPCAAVLVHVFDINRREFAVVRAFGPNADRLLLFRTPDREQLFVEALRRTRTIGVAAANGDARFRGGRWDLVGLAVESALCGPVQHGGRYLGIIELVNPEGGGPFHEVEVNALDYICDQLADFIASRPIVLDADAVIPAG